MCSEGIVDYSCAKRRGQRLSPTLVLLLFIIAKLFEFSHGLAFATQQSSTQTAGKDITCLFDDEAFKERIKKKLPLLFQIAEERSSRAGKIGMEVGTLREQILIAMLIYKFGRKAVDVNTPPNYPEVDVMLFGKPISIKTVTVRSNATPTLKLVWTVDWLKVEEFVRGYEPRSDMLLVIIRWGGYGGLFAIPLSAQKDVFNKMGKESYLKLPQKGTNPRGIEISKEALSALLKHHETRSVEIFWERKKGTEELEPYSQWLAYWAEE
ncbi:MAG: hypothetical protein RUDDFDWM_000645 [Candidatus Fervidibacterota bacterium]